MNNFTKYLDKTIPYPDNVRFSQRDNGEKVVRWNWSHPTCVKSILVRSGLQLIYLVGADRLYLYFIYCDNCKKSRYTACCNKCEKRRNAKIGMAYHSLNEMLKNKLIKMYELKEKEPDNASYLYQYFIKQCPNINSLNFTEYIPK